VDIFNFYFNKTIPACWQAGSLCIII